MTYSQIESKHNKKKRELQREESDTEEKEGGGGEDEEEEHVQQAREVFRLHLLGISKLSSAANEIHSNGFLSHHPEHAIAAKNRCVD